MLKALSPITSDFFLSVICLDLYRERVTRTADKNSHDFKRNSYGTIESTVKFTKLGFSVEAPLLFKLHIRRSGTFVNLKEQFDNMSYRLSLSRLQLSNLKATVAHQKYTIISNFDFDLLRVELGSYDSLFDETNSTNNLPCAQQIGH